MSGISVWITTILAVVIIGVVADLLLSGNRMHKFIRGIFGVLTLFVIAAPLPSLVSNGFDFEFDWGGSTNIDQDFLDSIHRQQIKVLERGVIKMLEEKGVAGVQLTIKGKVDRLVVEVEQVTIDISKAVITPNNPNINIGDYIAGLVADGLKVDKSKIFITKYLMIN